MHKANNRHHSISDQTIIKFDRLLRTLSGGTLSPTRPSPAEKIPAHSLSQTEEKHIAGLMRINHTGEVCAQALYQGQALAAKSTAVKTAMQASAAEEEDHLAWCEQRLNELNSQPSYLNPLFYGLSFGLGAAAGVAGDKWSLGFVEATEDQVCKHLTEHLDQIPTQDKKTRVILEQMLVDEKLHGAKALDHGGVKFDDRIKKVMSVVAKVMTKTTYKI